MNQGLSEFLASIIGSNPSWDLLIILFFIVGTFVYGIVLNRNRTVVLLVSIYMSLAITETFPLSAIKISDIRLADFNLKIIVFLLSLFLIFILLSRSALRKAFKDSRLGGGAWWHTFVFAFLQVGLFISTILSFSSTQTQANFSPFIQQVLTTDIARFLWIILPILAMILVGRKKY